MAYTQTRYLVPIDVKPTVLEAGLGIHGERPEVFRHDGFWSLQLCFDPAELTIGDMKLSLARGCAVMRPPYQPLRYEYQANPWRGCYVHFVSHPLAGEPVSIPVVQDTGTLFDELRAAVMEASALLIPSPLQAEIRIWDTLWRVARLTKHSDPAPVARHPAIQRAVEFVDISLAKPIKLDTIVEASGVSHSHLNRLFHSELGMTVGEHIRKRRAQRAKQLLHFTSMPIQAIAVHIGMPDLQQFNKFVRSEFGAGPREFRSMAYLSRQASRADARHTPPVIR